MDLKDLDLELDSKYMEGFWSAVRVGGVPEPKPSCQPHVWKWHDIYDGLLCAGELVGLDKSERRTLKLINPGLKDGFRCATRTLQLSVQLVKPGEIARAHRHNFAAVRFVVKGHGACTVVEGEQFPMAEGDLILTPNWTWHDHINASDVPIVWLDGHDGPLIKSFEVAFFEAFPKSQQSVERPQGFYARQSGLARPAWANGSMNNPPYRYIWSETYAALQTLASGVGDPCDGVILRYVNPLNGGWTLPTMSCEIQLLRPGEQVRRHRHTSSAIYHVFRGQGCTIIENKNYEWTEGDCFVVPLWSWHKHENRSAKDEAILFSINDRPIMEALKLYREEEEY
jgi:1-hydroxy-2-naphthoate dioxygenase